MVGICFREPGAIAGPTLACSLGGHRRGVTPKGDIKTSQHRDLLPEEDRNAPSFGVHFPEESRSYNAPRDCVVHLPRVVVVLRGLPRELRSLDQGVELGLMAGKEQC